MGCECHAQVKKTVWRWRLTRMYIDMAACARHATTAGPSSEKRKKNSFQIAAIHPKRRAGSTSALLRGGRPAI